VGVWPESLAGAPEATRERVALRCLQEVAEGAALAGGERLRVDATRSCEELLIELIGQVRSPFVTKSILVVQNFRFTSELIFL
jgi:hypothetical protein